MAYDIRLLIKTGNSVGYGEGNVLLDNPNEAYHIVPQSRIYSMSTSQQLLDNKFEIGRTACSEINLEIMEPVNVTIPKMAELRPQVRKVDSPAGTAWTPMGVYYIDTRRTEIGYDENGNASNRLIISGFDGMLKTSIEVSIQVDSDGKTTRKAIIESVLKTAGMYTGTEESPNFSNYVCDGILNMDGITTNINCSNKLKYYTGREILGFVAATLFGSFMMDENGKLKFVNMIDVLDS